MKAPDEPQGPPQRRDTHPAVWTPHRKKRIRRDATVTPGPIRAAATDPRS